MEIAGLQKTSLIDYPNNISCIVFTQGCNFRCPYCHNPSLITAEEDNFLPLKEFWNFLEERRNLIDGVTITGGEPTLQSDLIQFIKKIREMDLKIKLDTNGTRPETLKELFQLDLINYLAMDIKAPLNKYAKIVGDVDIEKIKKSINLILNLDINYEFRTTVVPTLHQKDDLMEIGKTIKGCKNYYIQNFRPINTLNPELEKLTPFPPSKLKEFKEIVSEYVNKVEIRN